MQVKLLLGIILVIVGLVVAVAGVVTVREPEQEQVRTEAPVVGDQNESEREEAASMMLPIIAGLTIAAGAALIGIGMGNFRHPKIVPPDSPQAEKAATTRPLS
jgi:hypothetical protein